MAWKRCSHGECLETTVCGFAHEMYLTEPRYIFLMLNHGKSAFISPKTPRTRSQISVASVYSMDLQDATSLHTFSSHFQAAANFMLTSDLTMVNLDLWQSSGALPVL